MIRIYSVKISSKFEVADQGDGALAEASEATHGSASHCTVVIRQQDSGRRSQ